MTCLDCGAIFEVEEEERMTVYCPDCSSGHLKFTVWPAKKGVLKEVEVQKRILGEW